MKTPRTPYYMIASFLMPVFIGLCIWGLVGSQQKASDRQQAIDDSRRQDREASRPKGFDENAVGKEVLIFSGTVESEGQPQSWVQISKGLLIPGKKGKADVVWTSIYPLLGTEPTYLSYRQSDEDKYTSISNVVVDDEIYDDRSLGVVKCTAGESTLIEPLGNLERLERDENARAYRYFNFGGGSTDPGQVMSLANRSKHDIVCLRVVRTKEGFQEEIHHQFYVTFQLPAGSLGQPMLLEREKMGRMGPYAIAVRRATDEDLKYLPGLENMDPENVTIFAFI